MMLTGLLGGSFNPAHGGHRSISLFALDRLQLDEIWWLVSPGNPLKSSASDMASLKVRLASAKAKSKNSLIKASSIESILKTRYTIDTLIKLKRKYPKKRFVWIMGADNLAQFHRWHRWREIANIIPIAIIERPGYNSRARHSMAALYLRRFGKKLDQKQAVKKWHAPVLVFLRFRPDFRSATMIRKANPNWHTQYAD